MRRMHQWCGSICRTLPIFETYCSDAVKPQIDLLAAYQIPNDAHKEMPKENIIITFHQEFNGLWLRTIESNYEFDTVYAWIDHWLDVRKCTCDLLAASSTCLHKLLGNRKLGDAGKLFDALHDRYNKMMVAHLSYPREHRPFEEKPEIPTLFNKAKRDYFDGIQNFANQLINFIKKEEQAKRLAIYNLKTALAALPNVQKFFDEITLDSEHQSKHVELCALEEKVIFETYYIHLCVQTSKPFGTLIRAKYHLLEKNNEFLLRRFFRKSIPEFDTKTVPNGLRTQRIQRKTRNFEGDLTEISLK